MPAEGVRLAGVEERKAAVQSDLESAAQARKKLQQQLNRLDEAFLFERSIDINTYNRHADRVREQMTLLKIDEHSSKLEDVEVVIAGSRQIARLPAEVSSGIDTMVEKGFQILSVTPTVPTRPSSDTWPTKRTRTSSCTAWRNHAPEGFSWHQKKWWV